MNERIEGTFMGKTLVLIDGHALAFRQFFALERTGMKNSDNHGSRVYLYKHVVKKSKEERDVRIFKAEFLLKKLFYPSKFPQ